MGGGWRNPSRCGVAPEAGGAAIQPVATPGTSFPADTFDGPGVTLRIESPQAFLEGLEGGRAGVIASQRFPSLFLALGAGPSVRGALPGRYVAFIGRAGCAEAPAPRVA